MSGPGSQVAVLTNSTPAGARAEDLDFGEMLRRAQVLAKTQLVPKPLQGNPEAIVLVGALGAELGIPFVTSLSEIHVIEGRPSPSAQMRLALVRRAGHEAEFVESSEERAVIRGRRRERRNDPNGWTTVAWTMEQARRAGLTDRWVEQWQTSSGGKRYAEKFIVGDRDGLFSAEDRARLGLPKTVPAWAQKLIDAGEIKQKDNWVKYPADMLRARAASTLCRMAFSDVLTGLGVDRHTAEEMGVDTAQDVDEPLPEVQGDDADTVDAELVEQAAGPEIAVAPPGPAVDGATQSAASAEDRDNAAGVPVVGPAAAPGPVHWRDRARAAGVKDGTLLKQAREFAQGRDLPQPGSLDEVVDEQLVFDITEWLGE